MPDETTKNVAEGNESTSDVSTGNVTPKSQSPGHEAAKSAAAGRPTTHGAPADGTTPQNPTTHGARADGTTPQNPATRTQTVANDINVRSTGYLIAHTDAECPRCHARTRLCALALPPGHETLALDEQAESEESAVDTWEAAPAGAFLFDVAYLPDAVQRRLAQDFGAYAIAGGGKPEESHWTNHCELCGLPWADQELFCEPDGAFMPMSEAAARSIELSAVDEPFVALAAGYACDPAFFGVMRRV